MCVMCWSAWGLLSVGQFQSYLHKLRKGKLLMKQIFIQFFSLLGDVSLQNLLI